MNHTRALRVLLVIGLTLTGWPAARAEVSVDDPGGVGVNAIVLADIVDDSDPIGSWIQYRPISPNRVLNADGDARGDGRPDLAFFGIIDDGEPVLSRPAVVWAYNAGTDFDIAFAEWEGSAWTATAFLTCGTDNEIDPRVFVEADDTVHVVWWTDGVEPEVYLSSRAAGSTTWDLPVLVTEGAETGRRPSVAVLDGVLRVAYERDSAEPGMAQDVMVATLQAGGGFTFERVASTARAERLDAVLHAASDRLWLDWKHVPGEFGSASYDAGVWSGNGPESWNDPSWIGVEDVRKRVRTGILD